MIRALAICGVSIAIFTGCDDSLELCQPTVCGTGRANEKTNGENTGTYNMYEAFFRYLFSNNVSGAQQNAEGYFLKIKGKDPSPAFLARFKGHSPPIKEASAFVEGEGLEFRIDDCKQIDDDTFEITGGYYEGNLSASGGSYRLTCKNGKWIVKAVGAHWVS